MGVGKIYKILLIILFLFMISFALLNDLVHFYKVPLTTPSENRNLATMPVFNLGKLDPFVPRYTAFFNDHFPFREEIKKWNSLFSFFVLHESPLPKEVSVGKDGWIFYRQKEILVYNGKFNLSPWRVKSIAKELHNRTIKYRGKGIRFYVAFPPMKPEVYPEKLPAGFRRAMDGTVTDQIIEAISVDSTIAFIDLRKALLKAKKEDQLYPQTDNHWNQVGAFFGYQAIMNRICKDFPFLHPLTRADFNFKMEQYDGGNLANMIGLDEYFPRKEKVPVMKKLKSSWLKSNRKKPDWAKYIDDYELIATTKDSSLPKILVIRDSYTYMLMPYLNESFNTTTYLFDS
ncbi:MAG: hypothetical protein WCL00_04110 [Bacteroidota bacterium]